jgi:hypothetical protein
MYHLATRHNRSVDEQVRSFVWHPDVHYVCRNKSLSLVTVYSQISPFHSLEFHLFFAPQSIWVRNGPPSVQDTLSDIKSI